MHISFSRISLPLNPTNTSLHISSSHTLAYSLHTHSKLQMTKDKKVDPKSAPAAPAAAAAAGGKTAAPAAKDAKKGSNKTNRR
jgi:hypothetical protein